MLTDREIRKLQAMSEAEHKEFMDRVFPLYPVCAEAGRIRREKGEAAFEEFMWDCVSKGLYDAEEEATVRSVEAQMRSQNECTKRAVEDQVRSPRPLEQSHEGESADAILLKAVMQKIVSSKVNGVDLSYVKALDVAQRENPELAAKVLGGMNQFRENPPRPWER